MPQNPTAVGLAPDNKPAFVKGSELHDLSDAEEQGPVSQKLGVSRCKAPFMPLRPGHIASRFHALDRGATRFALKWTATEPVSGLGQRAAQSPLSGAAINQTVLGSNAIC